MRLLSVTLQTRTVLSSPVETMDFPSLVNATAVTFPRCPASLASESPEATSHSFSVLSWLAVARYVPSGEKLSAATRLLCPGSVLTSMPVAASQMSTVYLPAARYFPSGEMSNI